MAHEYRGGELLALLLLEEDVVSSVRHRTQLTSLFACPLQDSANRVEALYGNYAPKRAGIGIRSPLLSSGFSHGLLEFRNTRTVRTPFRSVVGFGLV